MRARDQRRVRGLSRAVLVAVASLLLALACFAALAGCAPGLPGDGAARDVAESLPSRAPVGLRASQLQVVRDREADEPAEPEAEEVSVMMVGDVLVHEGVWQSGETSGGKRDYAHLFAQVSSDIASADLAIVSQETPLGGDALGISGYPTFNSPQEIGDAEAEAGFDAVTCATNHALDKGNKGVKATLSFWRKSHPAMGVLGIADSHESYDDIYVYEKGGIRVAVLNYTFSTNGIAIPEENPYAIHMLSEDAIASDVERARSDRKADFVIVCPHWGTEYRDRPDESQRAWARVMADAGVDVVIGTHPHVIEPVEVVTGDSGKRTLVFWSLGNFVSCQTKASTMVGGMAKATLRKDADGTCSVSGWEFDPVVTQRSDGTGLTTYRLDKYTEDLASASTINSADAKTGFSREWVVNHCAEVLGDSFDKKRCRLAGGAV